jgi:C1A family cysteine protease
MRKSKPKARPKPKHKYNWKPDLPDQRDHFYAVTAPKKVPNKIDLREECPPVFNQGQIGSCTGNALAGAVEFMEKSTNALSRLFIYYNERAIEGHTDQDAGASLRDGVKSLSQYGACLEKEWKYSKTNVLKKPSAPAYKSALTRAITEYVRLIGLPQLKQCLADGFPFVFGFSVYESFETAEVAKSGIMPMPGMSEHMLGGHAVMAVGYDDSKKCIIVRNSWGESWGDGGYFYMPYEYVQSAKLSQDFWTIRK